MTDRMITIGAGHYRKKARWPVLRAGLPFREECHPVLPAEGRPRLAGDRFTAEERGAP